jgi:hypothetical protein
MIINPRALPMGYPALAPLVRLRAKKVTGEVGDWVLGGIKNLGTAGRRNMITLMQSAPSLVDSDARSGRGRYEWSKKTFLTGIILTGIILTGLWTCSSQAFEIYLDTNAPASASRASELFDANKWKETAATIDGIWFAAQGMTKVPEGISLEQCLHTTASPWNHVHFI